MYIYAQETIVLITHTVLVTHTVLITHPAHDGQHPVRSNLLQQYSFELCATRKKKNEQIEIFMFGFLNLAIKVSGTYRVDLALE